MESKITVCIDRLRLTDRIHASFSTIELEEHGRIDFLCDTRSSNSEGGIFCSSKKAKSLLFSPNNGRSWYEVFKLTDAARIVRFHSGPNVHIVQTADPFYTFILSHDFEIIKRFTGPRFPWHGSQGAGFSKSGTFIFSEYQTGNDDIDLSIWRCPFPYDNLTPVLTKRAGRRPPIGEIRHFHTCFPDPYNDGTWYASSGDITSHNRFWISTDDGLNWIELIPRLENRSDIVNPERALRFTSAIVLQYKKLLWATDDGLGIGRPAVVLASIDREIINLKITDFLDKNYARSLIKSDQGCLIVTEAKSETDFVDFFWINSEGKRISTIKMNNLTGDPSPVTISRASSSFEGGVAFFNSIGAIASTSKRGILQIKLVKETQQ